MKLCGQEGIKLQPPSKSTHDTSVCVCVLGRGEREEGAWSEPSTGSSIVRLVLAILVTGHNGASSAKLPGQHSLDSRGLWVFFQFGTRVQVVCFKAISTSPVSSFLSVQPIFYQPGNRCGLRVDCCLNKTAYGLAKLPSRNALSDSPE